MRLTTRTNLAMRTLMYCAVNDGHIVRRHEVARCCNASENHLAQVVNTLAQLGFLETQRGRAGGLRLGRPPSEIRVGQVFRAFEAGTPFAECFDPKTNSCPLLGACLLRPALAEAVEAFYSALDRLTLADLVAQNAGLERLMQIGARITQPACSAATAA
jgi:Rrf2 family nitric oxide-sensitive transcriptional repressor